MGDFRFTKDSYEFQMFGEIWKIVEKLYTPDESDAYFSFFQDNVQGFYDKWKGTDEEMAKALTIMCIDIINGRYKKLKRKGDG